MNFNPDCRRCPRLSDFLDAIKCDYPQYYARPVPSFGDPAARLLIVGLAPGMHGANATGRPFTGDHAGILLYRTLHNYGFASRPESLSADDGLQLQDCRITNAVRCLPPQNKPVAAEVRECNPYLAAELADVPTDGVVLALGALAHNAVLKALNLRATQYRFGHATYYELGHGRRLISSYHCSRYNTQTGRLTTAMFDSVFARIRNLLDTA